MNVEGEVRMPDGSPLAGARAVLYRRDTRGSRRIGEATTDLRGRYQIEFAAETLTSAGAGLEVRVLRRGGRGPIATSGVMFDAGSATSFDIEITDVGGAPSEFERLHDMLAFAAGGVAPAELSDEQITHVSAATGMDREDLAALVESERRAGEMELPAPAVYALLRAGFSLDPDELARQEPGALGRAIDDALSRHLVPAELDAVGDELVTERLPQLHVDALLRPAGEGQPGSFGDLLATVLPEEARRREFARLFVERPADDEKFWEQLGGRRGFTRARVRKLRDTFELGLLTGSHVPLVQELQERMGGRRAAAVRDFAAYDRAEWAEAVEAVGPPKTASGRTRRAKVNAYADQLARTFEARYPTAVLASRIEQEKVSVPGAVREDLGRFFKQNPEFELGVEPVSAFLAADSDANLGGIRTLPRLREELMRLERVVKIVPPERPAGHGLRYETVNVLLEEGFDSSHKIERVGERGFLRRVTDRLGGGEEEAMQVFAIAQQHAALALALLARYSPVYNTTAVAAVPTAAVDPEDEPAPAKGMADLRNLFGSLDFCDCEHCRSAYGPAAYLVDVLRFLDDQEILDQLAAPGRRPDLRHLELNCENTNRRLPYIDLVNEVLEDAVEPRTDGRFPQTTWSEAELAAHPEHINAAAYEALKEAKHPWTLPFDLWLDEARLYLSHLEVPRRELMEVMRPADRWTDEAITCERLGLSRDEAKLITDAGPSNPWEAWGLQQHVSGLRDTRDGSSVSGPWDDVLKRVSVLLQQSRLEYADLLNLLELRFVNAGETPVTVEGDECDFTKMNVPWLHGGALTRLHRFVRLWRALGWSMHDLDRAIAAFGQNDITAEFLAWVSHVQRLHDALAVPVTILLSWWSPLDTHTYRDRAADEPVVSPYDRLFQNRSVLNPPSSALALNPERTGLAVASTEMTPDDRAAVGAGLGIDSADLSRLLVSEVPNELSLANLSRLHAIVTLARALRLSVRDWLRVRSLTGVDPFPAVDEPDDDSPRVELPEASARTLEFMEEARRIRDSGFTLDELDYLLRDRGSSATPVGLSEEQRKQLLEEIREGLRRIAEETQVASDPRGEVTGRFLAQLGWSAELIDALLSEQVLNHDPLASVPLKQLPDGLSFPDHLPANLRGKVQFDEAAARLSCLGAIRPSEREALRNLAGSDTTESSAYQDAVENLYERSRDGLSQRMGVVRKRMQSLELPEFSAPLHEPVPLPPALAERLYHDPGSGSLRFVGFMSEAERDRLRRLSNAEPYGRAIVELFNHSESYSESDPGNRFLTPSDVERLFFDARSTGERFEIVLGKLVPVLRRRSGEAWVAQKLAAALGVAPETTLELLTRRLDWSGRPGIRSIEAFLDSAFAQSAPRVSLDGQAFSDQHDACRLLHKAALILSNLRVTPGDLPLLRESHWQFLNSLATRHERPDVPTTYARWRSLVSLFALRDRLPAGADVLARVFATAESNDGDVPAAVAELLGWSSDDIANAAANLGIDEASDYLDAERLTRLVNLLQRLGRLGVSAEQAAAWCGDTVGPDDAAAIRQAVRAKTGAREWLERARALRDPLRKRQRAALVDYLVARDGLRDSNDLYGHYLLDVEMDPCMLTSRIRQAMSSVQLYVQRCLLNLEEGVSPSAVPADRWQWMRSYRVWEANRKVFFYPENWIEPELRRDKSPIFAELEGALQQGDVTQEAVERAFRGYLDRLQEISRLEIAGAAREPDDGVLHVVGRTFNAPHVYYYRRREKTGRWNPWETIDLDIEGDHLAPVFWNGQLYLFWPRFRDTAKEPAAGQQGRAPEPLLEMQLAFSVRATDRWSPTQQLVDVENFLEKRELFYVVGKPERDVLKVGFGHAGSPSSPHTWVFRWAELRHRQLRRTEPGESWRPVASPDRLWIRGNAFVEPFRRAADLRIPFRAQSVVVQVRDETVLFQEGPYRVIFPNVSGMWTFDSQSRPVVMHVAEHSFFVEDGRRTYHVEPVIVAAQGYTGHF